MMSILLFGILQWRIENGDEKVHENLKSVFLFESSYFYREFTLNAKPSTNAAQRKTPKRQTIIPRILANYE